MRAPNVIYNVAVELSSSTNYAYLEPILCVRLTGSLYQIVCMNSLNLCSEQVLIDSHTVSYEQAAARGVGAARRFFDERSTLVANPVL